ncbi:hypothetical protein QUA54_05045 [Microcoleus sp. MOSTC5]|uniref:hypothetical protein n=1 Tax=Microcoleus sp. MOSTC5 TaxID=3055378 RepID=UPI002FD3A8D0
MKLCEKSSYWVSNAQKRAMPCRACSAVVKLPGMPLNKRFILQVPRLSDPNSHQPTPADSAYLDPIARLQNSVPRAPASSSDEPSGTSLFKGIK